MVENISELNRVLLAARAVADDQNRAARAAVLEQCESAVIEGRMPDHQVSLRFTASIGFIVETGEQVKITEKGLAFLALNPDASYDLVEEQKRLLLRSCFLQGPLRDRTRRLLKGFAPAFKEETYRWSEIDSAPLDTEDWMIEHLRQLGLLQRLETALQVEPAHVKAVASFLEEGKGWTEEEAEEYFKEKRELGRLAEDLIVAYEARRLREAGFAVEAECVRRVSAVRVNAGYDVESFDGAGNGIGFDRFIEVKGSKSPDLRLMWSENEMNVAKKLKDRYWIYFQGGIDITTRQSRREPLMFRNPFESLLEHAQVTATPTGLIVEGRLRGAVR